MIRFILVQVRVTAPLCPVGWVANFRLPCFFLFLVLFAFARLLRRRSPSPSSRCYRLPTRSDAHSASPRAHSPPHRAYPRSTSAPSPLPLRARENRQGKTRLFKWYVPYDDD
ncbi:hypothetical protein B0H10DRAFT_2015130 [Mycena sp. CBHHK59/15]|nr:hypothetical protein B0H10DRAFT_2015130 [Mycena sp. CBHHK59/15]